MFLLFERFYHLFYLSLIHRKFLRYWMLLLVRFEFNFLRDECKIWIVVPGLLVIWPNFRQNILNEIFIPLLGLWLKQLLAVLVLGLRDQALLDGVLYHLLFTLLHLLQDHAFFVGSEAHSVKGVDGYLWAFVLVVFGKAGAATGWILGQSLHSLSLYDCFFLSIFCTCLLVYHGLLGYHRQRYLAWKVNFIFYKSLN